MNVHYFQHVPFEDLGSIADWAKRKSHRIGPTRFFEDDPLPSLEQLDWLIVMGGPMNIYEERRHPWLAIEKRFIEQAIAAGKVVIGICLGAQLIADVLGAKVYRNTHKEIGWFPIERTSAADRSSRFKAFPSDLDAFHWHGDTFDIPDGAIHLACSKVCENQAFIYEERVLALQFHLEMTRQGAERLTVHCADELVTAPFIQTAPAILSDPRRFQALNETMDWILDRLPSPA